MRRCLSTDVNVTVDDDDVTVDDDDVTFTRNGLQITSGTYAGAGQARYYTVPCTPILVPRVRVQNSRKQRNSMRSLLNV